MRIVVTIVLFLLIEPFLMAQKDHKYIRQGNKEYINTNYEKSEIDYRRALDQNANSEKATFNLGDALYKSGKFEEAGTEFEKFSSLSIDKQANAASHFNRGNSLLKAGALEESINSFKRSLLIDPSNHQTKYNLAYAQDQLNKQEKQEQENSDDSKNQDNKDKEKESDNKDDKKNGDENEEENSKNEQNSDEQNNNNQQQNRPADNRMTKEDAERLLQALANEEQEVQERVKREKAAAARVKTIKNW